MAPIYLSIPSNPESSARFYRFTVALEVALGRALQTVALWQRRRLDRELLAVMDSRMLSDIGLTRSEIDRELAKPFWRA